MKTVSIVLFAGMVGCALLQPVPATQAAAFKEKVLHSFGNGFDGQGPQVSFAVKGLLYGTTYGGGLIGGGTAFTVDQKTGAETVVYSFDSKQGRNPSGDLINLKGRLYGTTQTGGTADFGTAFALNPKTGAERVLYSFCSRQNCPDGAYPTSLIEAGGTLYGTTNQGGTGTNYYGGTVFALDPKTGTERVLYSFCGQENCTDGAEPAAALIDVNGTFYGTTGLGGRTGCTGNDPPGCGTVFSLDPKTRTEAVLHAFGNGTDGRFPDASLIAVNGLLYGTTSAGGRGGCFGHFGCGTVFSIDLNTGAETVVYTFCSQTNCTDGAAPYAALIDVDGTLYGTTSAGGNAGCGSYGCGTVFSIALKTGAEKVLYSFCSQPNCTDGASPSAGLIAMNGKLYGATGAGGAYGYGTVFVLTKKREAQAPEPSALVPAP